MKALHVRCFLLGATLLAVRPGIGAETPGSGNAVRTLAPLPAGLTLPVQLSRTLRAGKITPGSSVRATTTQRIPLSGHTFLPSGAVLEGQVSAVTVHSITLRFDTITYRKQSRPIVTRALAVASFVSVSNTGVPASGSTDRGNPSPANWTTAQVGGDQVVRSGWSGPLINSTTQTVGSADYWGVYTLSASPDAPPHALGPFSAQSTGLFGYAPDCAMVEPRLTIQCATSRPTLRQGDVLLLEIE